MNNELYDTTMRPLTKKLIQMMDDGYISAEEIVNMTLNYMSEDDVANMMWINQILDEEDDELED